MDGLYIANVRKYKRLDAIERRKAHLSKEKSISWWIAKLLSRSKSTIFSEIKCGEYNGKSKLISRKIMQKTSPMFT